jgi:hypothetical protein
MPTTGIRLAMPVSAPAAVEVPHPAPAGALTGLATLIPVVGMKAVYQPCTSDHLQRYLYEFDFRYNNRSATGVEDKERADLLLKGISGKRLTYKRPAGAYAPLPF